MNPPELTWNYEEFLCFLLLHASYVDMEFSEEEKMKLNEKFGPDLVAKMHDILYKMSDYETLETILAYKGVYFPTIDQKNEIMNSIKKLFFADGDYSIMEREMFRFLEKLM
ncbi:MAG TPA: hypothetical protein PKC30_08330 [Saprospiraceae bacterium]|nr:hypothetical protein [Saprospiraceae bacterium]